MTAPLHPHVRMRNLINEVSVWSRENFGEQRSEWLESTDNYQRAILLQHISPLLGIIEEIGELCDAVYSHELGLVKDSIADIFIYLADYIARLGPGSPEIIIDWDRIAGYLAIESTCSPAGHTSMMLSGCLGRIVHCNLKRHQGIRGWENNQKFFPHLSTLLADLLILVGRMLGSVKHHYITRDPQHLTAVTVPELFDITEAEWARVKQRNWKKSPTTGA